MDPLELAFKFVFRAGSVDVFGLWVGDKIRGCRI